MKQKAIEWAKRVPADRGSKIEVRRVAEADKVPQDNGQIRWVRPTSRPSGADRERHAMQILSGIRTD